MTKKTYTERMEARGSELVGRVKEIAQDANARKVIVKDQSGKELVTIPLGWGAAGGAVAILAAPWLAVLAAIGAAVAKVKIEVERADGPAAGDEGTGAAGKSDQDPGMTIIDTETPGWDATPTDRL